MYCFEYDNDFLRILSFFKKNDSEFIPPLSQRVDIVNYSNKLSSNAINIFVCEKRNDIGHAGLYINDEKNRIAFLSSICVKYKNRRDGIAQQLMDEIIISAENYNMERIDLEVYNGNIRAIRFYQKLGFKFIGEKGSINLVMTKYITNTI